MWNTYLEGGCKNEGAVVNRTHSSTYKTAYNDACTTHYTILYVQSSSWRRTLRFETCRRHHKLKWYEGCSESNAPHFFSENICSDCTQFTHSITGCFLYTCYFSTQSPSTSTALHQRETSACMPSLYQLVSCSRDHVLTARITLSSSSNLVPRSASYSGPKRWKSDGARSGL